MPIPELERRRVETALEKFCRRVPPAIRPELSYQYQFRGNSVFLSERRPHSQDPTRHTEHVFAKFVYIADVGGWSLKWRDRNGRWHVYDRFEEVPQFRDVLREVENDPTGIFFG